MPRGWKDKSEISTWVDVSSVAGRPKWKEVEEHPMRSNPAEERTSRIHEPAQMEIAGPIDEHFNDALEDGGDFSSFPAWAKGKVMYSLYI